MLKLKNKVQKGQKVYMALPVEVKSIDKDLGTLEAIFSTADIDRHGDKVLQDGWDLAMFKKNPVILNSHNYNDAADVIGKASNVRVEANKLQGDITFAVNENPKAKVIFDLYAGGFLHAFSVGFIVTEFKQNKDGTTDYYTIAGAELLEVSAVSVPANARALAKAKGIDTDQLPEEDASKDIVDAELDQEENKTNPKEDEQPPKPEPEADPNKVADEVPKDGEAQNPTQPTDAGNDNGGDGGQGATDATTGNDAGAAGGQANTPPPVDNSVEKSYRAKVAQAIHNIESKEKAQLRAVASIISSMLNGEERVPKKTAEQIRKRKVNQAIRALMSMR